MYVIDLLQDRNSPGFTQWVILNRINQIPPELKKEDLTAPFLLIRLAKARRYFCIHLLKYCGRFLTERSRLVQPDF